MADPTKEVQRADEARMILDHPLVCEALNGWRTALANERARVDIKDSAMHTRLIAAEQAANAFETFFKTTIDTGKMAAVSLREKRKPIFRR